MKNRELLSLLGLLTPPTEEDVKMDLSAEQYIELQKIGQEILNKLTDDIQDRLGIVDLQIAISLCLSMTAHYISGIPDRGLRQLEVLKFATSLAVQTEYLAEDNMPGKKSNVTMRPEETN